VHCAGHRVLVAVVLESAGIAIVAVRLFGGRLCHASPVVAPEIGAGVFVLLLAFLASVCDVDTTLHRITRVDGAGILVIAVDSFAVLADARVAVTLGTHTAVVALVAVEKWVLAYASIASLVGTRFSVVAKRLRILVCASVAVVVHVVADFLADGVEALGQAGRGALARTNARLEVVLLRAVGTQTKFAGTRGTLTERTILWATLTGCFVGFRILVTLADVSSRTLVILLAGASAEATFSTDLYALVVDGSGRDAVLVFFAGIAELHPARKAVVDRVAGRFRSADETSFTSSITGLRADLAIGCLDALVGVTFLVFLALRAKLAGTRLVFAGVLLLVDVVGDVSVSSVSTIELDSTGILGRSSLRAVGTAEQRPSNDEGGEDE